MYIVGENEKMFSANLLRFFGHPNTSCAKNFVILMRKVAISWLLGKKEKKVLRLYYSTGCLVFNSVVL